MLRWVMIYYHSLPFDGFNEVFLTVFLVVVFIEEVSHDTFWINERKTQIKLMIDF